MNTKLKILHVEDVNSDALLINNKLKKSKLNYEILVVDTKDKFIKELKDFTPDIILSDHNLPSFNSHEALTILNKTGIKIPFIVVTAAMSDEFAADMIIKGANDYIIKDRLHRLPTAIQNALEKYKLQHEKDVIAEELIKSESRLKQTQAIAHLGSWELDYATGVGIWSDEQLSILGLELRNNSQSFETWISFIHPEDIKYVLQKINDIKSNVSNADFFHRIIIADGTVKHLHTQIRVKADDAGNPIGLHGATQDVTEMKTRENALQESQLNLQTIFENTSDGFVLVDVNGIVKSFNSKARDRVRLNLESELKVGKSIFDSLPDSRKNIYKENISKVLAGQILQYDHAYSRKNGEKKWFSFTFNPVYIAEKIEGFSITSSDITKRKNEEQQLKLLESVITNTNDAILITEAKHLNEPGPKIVYVNEAFTRMTGYTAEEVIGKTPRILQGPKTDRHELARLAEALRNWESCEVTTINYKKNGEEFWVNFSVSPVANEKGWITHWISIERDITQRKNEEQQKNILQETLQSSLNEIYIFDFDTFKFSYVNKGALLNLGYTEHEIKALTPLDIKPDFTAIYFKELVAALVNNEKEKIIFFTNHKRKDGSLYPAEIHLQLVTEGNNKRFLAIVLDITERKIIEQKLLELNNELKKSVKQLEISNTDLEQFAYVASHDLQEPLRMVSSFLSLLEKKYESILDDKGRQYIHFAVEGAKQMRQIILDILEFSRAGQTDDKQEEIDPTNVLNEVLAMLLKEIEEKKAVIKISELPVLHTFRAGLRQVLQNLISNSLKYHNTKHAVEITVTAKDDENYWQFAVSDNGIGIAAEFFDKIFIIFQRLHNKDEYSGTGIGLAVSKKTIESMGGKMWVESEIGTGTTFYFTIPKKSSSMKSVHSLPVKEDEVNSLLATEALENGKIANETAKDIQVQDLINGFAESKILKINSVNMPS